MSSTRADQILDIAEKEMRKGGFDAVSFRDIASAIGIKSASVHYHFPTKGDLGRAVVLRYADRFMDAMGAPDDPAETPADRIARLAKGYMTAFQKDRSLCLCTGLGAVANHLPDDTAVQVGAFYIRLSKWIASALQTAPLPGDKPGLTPAMVIATLQGAMVLAVVAKDESPLREAGAFLAGASQKQAAV